jgi:hypothetical protein
VLAWITGPGNRIGEGRRPSGVPCGHATARHMPAIEHTVTDRRWVSDGR